jgi:hypothetical protein
MALSILSAGAQPALLHEEEVMVIGEVIGNRFSARYQNITKRKKDLCARTRDRFPLLFQKSFSKN